MGLGDVISSIFALLLSLVVVLGLAWGSIYLLRRWQDRSLGAREVGAANDRSIRFIRALPLGPRERVVLIEVGEETMLLGVGAGGINVLRQWDAQGTALAPAATAAAATPPVPLPGRAAW